MICLAAVAQGAAAAAAGIRRRATTAADPTQGENSNEVNGWSLVVVQPRCPCPLGLLANKTCASVVEQRQTKMT